MPLLKYIRPNSVLVVCCGLLAKWLGIGLGLGLGPGNVQYFFFFFLWSYKCSEHLVFVGSVVSISAWQITYEYSIDDITTTWMRVNLASPLSENR